MLMAIEGADCSGKSSVAKALAVRLNAKLISFPNDNDYTGPMIREYLAHGWRIRLLPYKDSFDRECDQDLRAKMGTLAFQALQVANRMSVMPTLEKAEASGDPFHADTLVLARYWQSGWVYGSLDGLDVNWLKAVHQSMAHAHFNFLLDVEPEEALRRLTSRGLPSERYEGKLSFTTKVVDLYRELWKQESEYNGGWRVIDANQPFAKVCLDCWSHISGQPWSK